MSEKETEDWKMWRSQKEESPCYQCGQDLWLPADAGQRIRTLEVEVERLKDLLTWHHNRLNPIEYCQVCMDFKEDEKHKNLNSVGAQAPAPSPPCLHQEGLLYNDKVCPDCGIKLKPRRKVKP